MSRGRTSQAAPVVVTGTFLSGASIVARSLVARGVVMVPERHAAGYNDLAGSGCDAEMVSFHRRLLEAREVSWHDPSGLNELRMTESERLQASSLVEARLGVSRWGWCDPHTAFFLDDWLELLPRARWVFVIRPVTMVVWSAIWRGWLYDAASTPIGRALALMRIWAHVTAGMIDHAERRPECCRLIELPNQLETHDLDRHLEIDRLDLNEALEPRQLRTRCPGWISALARLDPPARRVTGCLARRRQDSPIPQRPVGPGGSGPRICLASHVRFTYSQTFVRDHLARLPAQVEWIVLGASPIEGADCLPLLTRTERAMQALMRELGVSAHWFFDRAVRRYLRRHHVQAVLAEFGINAAALYRVCRATGIPLVVNFHGYDVHQQNTIDRHLDAYRQVFEVAAALVVVSSDMGERLVELGAPQDKIVCIPCGVDTERFCDADPAAAPPVFLSVGRFVDKKAPLLTLTAFRKVLDEVPEARLVMVGDGALWFAAKLQAQALGIDEQVRFEGPLSHEEVAVRMRTARALVQHSLRTNLGDCEGTPVGILEAGASGLPVVSTLHTGIQQAVVDGTTGLLVAERDVAGMAAAMVRLARDPDLAARLGRQAREHVGRHFSMEASVGRLWQVVERSLREG